MLTKNDLQQISKVVQTAIQATVPIYIAQAIEELVNPQFDEVWKEFEDLKSKISNMGSQMVTKTYLDDKLEDLRADLMGIDKQQEQRMIATEHLLEEKQIFSPNDVAYLHGFDSFK